MRLGSIDKLLSGEGVRVVTSAGGGSLAQENSRKVTTMPLEKVESPTANVATTKVIVGLKSSTMERGVDLTGQLEGGCQRPKKP